MKARDPLRWNFGRYGSPGNEAQSRLFAALEPAIATSEFLIHGVLSLPPSERQEIAALARLLTIELADVPQRREALGAIDEAMRQRGERVSVGAWIVRPLFKVVDLVQPAMPGDENPEARAKLLGGAGVLLQDGMGLIPADMVMLVQLWIDRFLAENGQRPLPGPIVYSELFARQSDPERLPKGEFAILRAKLLAPPRNTIATPLPQPERKPPNSERGG